MRKLAATYAQLWRAWTSLMRAELVFSMLAPIAAAVLIASGFGTAGVVILLVLVVDSAVIWPVRRARGHGRSDKRAD